MKRALLALILALPLALSAQFRIVGTGLFTTLNDSTYRAKIDFRPDLTGNSYNATQLNDSMLVLSQKGQLYRLDSFYNASFSSAFIIVVEKNGNWGSPVGQIMVFQNNSSLAAPQAVYGANGATAGMQAGVDTWNALLLKVVADSASYWNEAYSAIVDSIWFSGTTTKTLNMAQRGGDTLSASFVITGGADSLYVAENTGVTLLTNGDTLDLTDYPTMPFDSVTFNINEGDASEQELKYSAEKGYLQYGGLDSVQIPLLPGIWYVRNDDSVTVSKGMVVRASGTLGASGRIKVKRMIADGSIPAMYVLGIAMHDIASGADGYVMTQGKIRQLNTEAYSEGAVLYADVDTLGGLTQTEPTGSNLKLPIAFVVHSASNGTLAVRIDAGSSLRDLHDVDTTGKVDGSVLRYDSTAGYWKASTTAGIVAGDTSVFVRQYQLSGTSGYLPRYTSDTTIGNSVMYQHSGNIGINSTTATNNKFQIGSVGSSGYAGNDLAIGNGTQAMAIEVASNRTNFATNTYFFMQPFSQNTADSSLTVDGNFRVAGGAGFGRAVRIGTQSSFLVNPTLGLMVNGNASRSDFTSWIYSNSSSIQDATVLRVGGSDNWNTDKEESIDLGFNRISSYYQGSNKWGLKFYTYPNATFTSGNVLTFNGDGNVGINTTTPAYRLDVNGDVNTTGMYKKSGTDIISGTTNHLAMFTGANTVGNSPLYNVANNQFIIGHTASGTGAKNTLEIRGTGNTDFDGSKVDLYVNSSGQDYHAPIISLRRSRSATAGAFTKANDLDWLGQVIFNGADGDEYTGGALIRAIVDGTTGNNDMPASLLFATTPDGSSTQTERMRITSAGRVGIGTSTPSEALDVDGVGRFRQSGGSGGGPIEISDRKSTFNQNINWNVYYDGSNWKYRNSDFGASIGFNNSGDLLFYNIASGTAGNNVTAFRERLKINENGNVGINTTTPTAKLHINNPNSTTSALNIVSNSNVIGSTNEAVSINMQPGQVNQNNTGVRVFNTIAGTSAEGNNTGIAISLNARNSSYGVYSAVSKNWGGSSLFGEAIGIYGSATTDSPAGFSYGGYFKNDTTQGTGFGAFIQTTTPKGSGTVTPLAIQHNSTELMRVQSSGNVGIATASPSRPLHVNSNISMIIPSGATGTRPTSGANGDIRYNTDNANFEWYSGTGWREAVNAARSPTAGLANRFSKFDANGLLDTSAVLVQSNGRIGIFNSPAAGDSALTITGGIRTTSSIRTGSDATINGMTVGLGASNVATNLAFGNGALASWDGTGSGTNVAIGAFALNLARQTLGASSNLAIGGNALRVNTNTANNVAIGADAMRLYNKTGAGAGGGNVAIGGSALYSLIVSGASPVANNVAIGLTSMFFTRNSDANACIGTNSMRHAEGNENVAIGQASLYSSDPGTPDYRTGINQNVSIGAGAMQNIVANTVGNVAIGKSALALADYEGDNGVYIGLSANASSTTATNEIAIGANTTGNGSNTTTIGNTSTTATYLPAGSLYINGTVSPARTLHVNGEARISDLATDTPTRIVGADADGDLGAITLGTGLSISSGTLNASGISSVYIPLNIFAAGDTVKNTTTAKEFFLVHSGLNGYCIDSYTVKAIAGTGSADIQIDKNGTGGNLQSISGTTVYTKDTNIALATGDYIRGQVYNLSGTLVGLGLTLEIKATCN